VKVFIDTNVLVGAHVSHGLCRELVLYVRQCHRALVSEQVVDEFAKVLVKKVGQGLAESEKDAAALRGHFQVLATPIRPPQMTRDPKDNAIVQAALDSDCEWLISGDKDLTSLKRVQGMPINTPRDFMEILGVEEEYL
jgi:putative PIN family toxin of toxin-antitoxin system